MSNIRKMFSNQARKAIVAGTVAGITAAIAAAPDGFTTIECLTIAGAVIGAFQATYWTTNADEPPTIASAPAWVDERTTP